MPRLGKSLLAPTAGAAPARRPLQASCKAQPESSTDCCKLEKRASRSKLAACSTSRVCVPAFGGGDAARVVHDFRQLGLQWRRPQLLWSARSQCMSLLGRSHSRLAHKKSHQTRPLPAKPLAGLSSL